MVRWVNGYNKCFLYLNKYVSLKKSSYEIKKRSQFEPTIIFSKSRTSKISAATHVSRKVVADLKVDYLVLYNSILRHVL